MHSKLSDEEVVRLYCASPLDTTSLPESSLVTKRNKIVIVGCGALGSDIAMMLARALRVEGRSRRGRLSEFFLAAPAAMLFTNSEESNDAKTRATRRRRPHNDAVLGR